MTQSFSKQKIIPLRKAFSADGQVVGKEATDFTPWLCKDDNLNNYLGEALGMNLKEPKKESKVGRALSLDILCTNTKDKSWVAIENQFGTADHKHLGQLLTYGAGLKTPTMIWIAEDFTEEHLVALKWLNKKTDTKTSFFAVKVQAIKIGDSPTAIVFAVVCKPDGYHIKKTREKQKSGKENLTSTQFLQKSYWQGLKKYLIDKGSKLSGQTPSPKPTQWFNIGKGGAGIRVKIHIAKSTARLEIYLNDKKTCKALFNLLHKDKRAIEKDLDTPLDWQEFPEKAYSSIGVDFKKVNFKDKKNWDEQYVALKFMIEKLDKVFTHRLLALNPSDWNPDA